MVEYGSVYFVAKYVKVLGFNHYGSIYLNYANIFSIVKSIQISIINKNGGHYI